MLYARQHFSGIRECQRSAGILVDVPACRAVDFPAFVDYMRLPAQQRDFQLVLPVSQGVPVPGLVRDLEGFRNVGRFSWSCHV